MSYYDGVKFGKEIYYKNLSMYGFNEREHSEKVIETCRIYAFNSKIKRTKSGKRLTKDLRLFYKGVADSLQAPNRLII